MKNKDLLSADYISHKVVPVSGYDDLARENEQLVLKQQSEAEAEGEGGSGSGMEVRPSERANE